jgi:hypothetical protein
VKPPTSAPPDGLVTWSELKFMLLFVFAAGFLFGVLAHSIHVIMKNL